MQRYVVRRGTKNWMVWDRHLRRPASIRRQEQTGLSEDEANHILRQLNNAGGEPEKTDAE